MGRLVTRFIGSADRVRGVVRGTIHAVVIVIAAVLTSCATVPPPRTSIDEQPPRLLNAFFGLDDALPARAIGICLQAPGADGMPVTFSRRVIGTGVRGANVAPAAFTVVTRSGARKTPACATIAPALGPLEGHTVLLVGDLGDAERDPPVRVEVTGALPLEGGADGRGLAVDVTPLEEGPTLVLAIEYPASSIASDCPESTSRIVVVVWAGGVVPAHGQTEEDHRAMYRVTTAAGSAEPVALGDLGDGDNYVHLCMCTDLPATRVDAIAGVLEDPRGDLNPDTWVDVAR